MGFVARLNCAENATDPRCSLPDADPHIPILKEAKAEYAKLQ